MRQKRAASSLNSCTPIEKVKTIQKSSKKKYLTKVAVKKSDLNKQWKLKNLIDSRLHRINQDHSIQDKFIKQYLVEWQQTQRIPWQNTWQPQQNIPIQSILYYLTTKRDRIIEKKRRKQQIKKNQMSVKRFEANQIKQAKAQLQSISKVKHSNNRIQSNQVYQYNQKQRVKQFQNTVDQDQKAKSNSRNRPKENNYISYLNDQQEYAVLIQRFLRNQRNSIKQQNSNIKSQFDQKTSKIIKQKEQNKTGQIIFKEKQQKQIIPQSISDLLFQSVQFHSEINKQSYFILKLNQAIVNELPKDKPYYISEQSLVLNFPFLYEKYLKEQINKQINQIKDVIVKQKLEFNCGQINISDLQDEIMNGKQFYLNHSSQFCIFPINQDQLGRQLSSVISVSSISPKMLYQKRNNHQQDIYKQEQNKFSERPKNKKYQEKKLNEIFSKIDQPSGKKITMYNQQVKSEYIDNSHEKIQSQKQIQNNFRIIEQKKRIKQRKKNKFQIKTIDLIDKDSQQESQSNELSKILNDIEMSSSDGPTKKLFQHKQNQLYDSDDQK